MSKLSMSCCAVSSSLLVSSSFGATAVALFEDFEDSTVGYTVHGFVPDVEESGSTAGTVGAEVGEFSELSESPVSRDYISRIAYSNTDVTDNVSGNYLIADPLDNLGSSYFGGQDIDSVTNLEGAGFDHVALQWTGIDVSSFGSDYSVSAFFGELGDGGNTDWDVTDRLGIWASLDSGAYVQVFNIVGIANNSTPFVDFNLDGVKNGLDTDITTTMTEYSADIGSVLGAGNDLDLQIRIGNLNSPDEDIAIDNFMISGTTIPEPSSSSLLLISACALLTRRSRR
ncbi:PEP-CTERM sorting domain-containing protein [Rubritalea spongiae]|uniref:PEP-CTERM sorting domain-containing protein n=1 Tax=Rubritalea spongiae TaxID=430797 RepID=A0ABW5E876_9BACT